MRPSNPNVLAIIPARGGSKGLPRKNILIAGGRPLVAWTIEAALNAKCVNRVVLSSDDNEIIAVAKEYGCETTIKRPIELATDESATIDVVVHALKNLRGYDYVVLLQPTSPLRNADDIDSAFNYMLQFAASSCVSVCPVEESPYWMYRFNDNKRLTRLIDAPAYFNRRQDLPLVYRLNGAIYIAQIQELEQTLKFVNSGTVGYIMARDRSIDIDTLEDVIRFESIITGRS